jgi:hypothetical protein
LPENRENVGELRSSYRARIRTTAKNAKNTKKKLKALQKAQQFDANLQTVIDAWPSLPDGLKAAILAIVGSTR